MTTEELTSLNKLLLQYKKEHLETENENTLFPNHVFKGLTYHKSVDSWTELAYKVVNTLNGLLEEKYKGE